jgi:Transglycosylase SLT domain
MHFIGGAGLVLLASLWAVSPGIAGTRKAPPPPVAAPPANPLDRVADAVDGAESSHGSDPAMWRDDPAGPQGPMQVSAAAASDVGGGDRFDPAQNRVIGRAYLAHLYRRYGDWPDAIAAYNWGIGHLEAWVRAGRPNAAPVPGVAAYLGRVLHDSGLCGPAGPVALRQPVAVQPRCVDLADWGHVVAEGRSASDAPSPFKQRLDKALRLALERARAP